MSTNEDQDSANVQDMSDSRGSPGALVVTGGGRVRERGKQRLVVQLISQPDSLGVL
jgi:hypothetical protein